MKPNFRNVNIPIPKGDEIPTYVIDEKEEAFLSSTGKPLFFDGYYLTIERVKAKGTDYNHTFYHCITEKDQKHNIRLLKEERLEKLDLIEPLLKRWKEENENIVTYWREEYKTGPRIWIIDKEINYTMILKPMFDKKGWVRSLLIITAYPTRGKEKVHNHSHLPHYKKGDLKNLYIPPKK